jgi:dipeptidyl aminopeptidase/acylaminoacyl peptidase
MLIEQPFSLANASGDVVRGDLRSSGEPRCLPALLICHGFTAHKDWGPFPYFGQRLAEQGFATIVFNFSHNGIGSNFRRFTEAEKFSRNTIGKELEDLRAVIDALSEGRLGGGVIDPSRIGLIGHSRGGGVAILSASRDHRIKGVAAWSSVSTFHRYTLRQKQAWERDGYLPVTVRGVKTHLRFGVEVLRDLEANRETYDLRHAVKRLRVPLLIVHGGADVAVKPHEPEELYAAADASRTKYVILEGVGHSYGAPHPYHGHHPAVERVIELTAQWFHSFIIGVEHE